MGAPHVDSAAAPADGTLVRRYLGGDEGAFDMLYSRYRKPLYGYLHKMLRGRQTDVDDLYQRTWARILKSLTRYRERDRFLSWMLRIAHNLVVDFYRRERPEVELDSVSDSLAVEQEGPGSDLMKAEQRAALHRAVSALPAEQREVVLLRLKGLSFKAIAEIQRTGLNTALGRMHYALQKLRETLIPLRDTEPAVAEGGMG